MYVAYLQVVAVVLIVSRTLLSFQRLYTHDTHAFYDFHSRQLHTVSACPSSQVVRAKSAGHAFAVTYRSVATS